MTADPELCGRRILDANALGAGPHTIAFNIAPAGPHTITPLSPLPELTAAQTLLDATTQPGYAGVPIIELSGASADGIAHGLTIGGAMAKVRGFVINRWNLNGIVITAPGVEVTNNFIGVAPDGTTQRRNRSNGVSIASSNASVSGNTIAWNSSHGVQVAGFRDERNSIRHNSIFSNGNRGIALDDGGRPNDLRDGDSGANSGQNHPVLTSAVWNAGILTVAGTLHSTPATSFDIDLYSNETCYIGAGGSGQGKVWRHTVQVTTDANGDAAIQASFAYPGTGFITSTATNRARTETSEFSPCSAVTNVAASSVQFAAATGKVTEGDGFVTVVVTRSGSTVGPATIELQYLDGSANIPGDYLPPASSFLVWNDGDGAPKNVNLPIVENDLYEQPEDFQVLLLNATGATLGTPSSTMITIEEDLSGPALPADLTIGVVTQSTSAPQGAPVSYQLILTNLGPNDASNVTMTMALPPQLLYEELRPPAGWTCTTPAAGTNGTIICTTPVQPFFGGHTTYFNLSTRVAYDAVGTIVNRAVVSHGGTDPNTENSTGSSIPTEVLPTIADLSIVKSTTAVNAGTGSMFRYTIKVSNSGPSIAAAATITDVLPPQLQFVSRAFEPSSTDVNCTTPAENTNGTITCNAYWLEPGETETVSLNVRVAPDAALGAITNTATVFSETADPDHDDRTSAASPVEIVAGADLSLFKSTSTLNARAGTIFSYTLSVQNKGPSAAADVVITDVLPAGLLFHGMSSTSVFTCTTPVSGTNGTVTCTTPSLKASIVAGVQILVRVASNATSGTVTNSASVTSSTVDLDGGDTTATAPPVTLERAAGTERRLDRSTASPWLPQTAPHVATTPRNALAVWREGTVGTSPPSGPVSIRGALFRPDAEGQTNFEIAAAEAGTDVTYPVVAAAADRYLVVWRESKSSQGRLLARRIRDDRSFLDPEPLVLETGAAVLCCSELGDPRPAVASNGRDFYVTWVSSNFDVRGVAVPAAGPVAGQPVVVSREADPATRGHYDLEVVWTSVVYVVAWLDQVFRIEPPMQEPYVLRYARVTGEGVLLDTEVSDALDGVIYRSITAAGLSDGAAVTVDYEEFSHSPNTRRHCVGVLLMTALGEPRDAYPLRCEDEPTVIPPVYHAKLLPVSTGFLLVEPGRRYTPVFRQFPILTSSADAHFNTLSPTTPLGPWGQEVAVATWNGTALFVYNRADRDASGTSVPRVFGFFMDGESRSGGRRRAARH